MEAASVEQELIRLENVWADATRRRDLYFLDQLLGHEFTLTTGRSGAEVRSRQEWLDVTRDRYAIESFEFEEFTIHVYDGTAVVRSRYRQIGRMDDQDRTLAYLMTDVWVRREGRWQAVTRHISPLDETPGRAS